MCVLLRGGGRLARRQLRRASCFSVPPYHECHCVHVTRSFRIVAVVPQCQQPAATVQIQAQAYLSDDPESSVECQAAATPATLQVHQPAKTAKVVANDTSCTPQPVLSGDFIGDPGGRCV